jgi:hypothetical protein
MPDPTSDNLPAELWPLLSALVDGTISAADQERLESLLGDSRAVRDAYRDFMQLESMLAWELAEPAAGNTAPEPERPRRQPGSAWRRSATWLLPVLAVAAAVVATVLPAIRPRPLAPAGPADAPPALLSDATDAEWADGLVREPGVAIAAGPLRLVAGSAQLRFASGAVVTLNAPSEIEVLGANRLFVRNGGVVPFVPPAAKGFTVVSPTGEVVDFGTEFSVSVGPQGQTDVYVLDGEVDVAGGHGGDRQPVRITQGFGSRLSALEGSPQLTDRPVVIDAFDGPSRALRWRDLYAERPATVVRDELHIPVEFRPQASDQRTDTQLVLEHDFSVLRGRRAAISFKVTLPNDGILGADRWFACVLDAGTGRAPMAYARDAVLGVLVSPHFEAGVRIAGESVPARQCRVFGRSEDAVGPYQVLVTLDDSPAGWERYGATTAGVTINGQSLLRHHPVEFPGRPRIGLQTFAGETSTGRGVAVVDDFSVSVSVEAMAGDRRGETPPDTPAEPPSQR